MQRLFNACALFNPGGFSIKLRMFHYQKCITEKATPLSYSEILTYTKEKGRKKPKIPHNEVCKYSFGNGRGGDVSRKNNGTFFNGNDPPSGGFTAFHCNFCHF